MVGPKSEGNPVLSKLEERVVASLLFIVVAGLAWRVVGGWWRHLQRSATLQISQSTFWWRQAEEVKPTLASQHLADTSRQH